ncbi:MAG: metal-dependent hydrolase [Bacteroidetes bacterium]|nr:metal-dependent hydrolase [Bacteroidota bacterium]
MKITFYGHSCFGVEINGKHIVFDPFISPNPLAHKIDINTIPCDYILISHGHEDHIADAISLAKRTGAMVVSNYEVITWLSKQGVENTHPMNTGGKWIFDFGKVKCVAAEHSSSMPDGSYGGCAMGFLLETTEGDFYYAGDTALMYDMKLIGDYRQINFSMLPIGDNFTMSIENAIIASDFIKCNTVIGMHYNTMDSIKINNEDAIQKFDNAGKKLILMEIGETLEL